MHIILVDGACCGIALRREDIVYAQLTLKPYACDPKTKLPVLEIKMAGTDKPMQFSDNAHELWEKLSKELASPSKPVAE